MGKGIAVIIPVYNVEQYLEACIESVLRQTILPEEIILVDDGSKDGSGTICDRYRREYGARIRVIHQVNGGLSAARNAGICESTTDYLLFVDSDDTIREDTCEQFLNAVPEEGADVITAAITSVWPDRQVRKVHTMIEPQKVVSGREFFKCELKQRTMFYESVHCMYSRKFLLENNILFVPRLLHEDQVFTTEVFLKAQRVVTTEIDFYNHLIRENSISTQKNQLPNAKSIIHICELLEQMVKDEKDQVLKKYLLDHAVDLYYNVFIEADLIHHKECRINKGYLKRNSTSKKNLFRTMLYMISERILDLEERFRK